MYEFLTDAIIAIVTAGVPLWLVARRSKPFGPAQAIAVCAWAVVAYGSFIAPQFLTVKDYSIDVRHDSTALARTMTLAVFSDTHLGMFRHAEWLARVVRAVDARKPDAVLIAGDLTSVMAGTREFAPFDDLKSRYGTYAVLGNWDYRVGAVDVRKAIGSHPVKLLVNRSAVIGPADAPVRIVGLDDLTYGAPDWDKALADAKPGETVIILSHEPDSAPQAEVRGAALVIAGHTHGGQIRLPFIGAIAHLPIHLDQSFDQGEFDFGKTKLFITPGVGESTARARLFRPPEISILHLTY